MTYANAAPPSVRMLIAEISPPVMTDPFGVTERVRRHKACQKLRTDCDAFDGCTRKPQKAVFSSVYDFEDGSGPSK